MGLLLEDEADCLNHQHKHRRHWPPIHRQSLAGAPYRASGLVPSPIAASRFSLLARPLDQENRSLPDRMREHALSM